MNQTRWNRKPFVFVAAATSMGLGLAIPAEVRAGYTVTLDAGSPMTVSPGVYEYDYTAQQAAGDQINTGNYFRIYDFSGWSPGRS